MNLKILNKNYQKLPGLRESWEIAAFPAIGQMSGCITTVSGRPYSEVVGRDAAMLKEFENHENDYVMSEQNNNRTKWLHLHLKSGEFEKINRQFKKTTCRKLSDYARKLLLGKPLIAATRDQSLDDFMAEGIRLRHELNSIGNNFNQAVKKTSYSTANFRV